jgi:hypothetical protein
MTEDNAEGSGASGSRGIKFLFNVLLGQLDG